MNEPLSADRIGAGETQPALSEEVVLPFRAKEDAQKGRRKAQSQRIPVSSHKLGALWTCAIVLGGVLLVERYTSLVQAIAFSHWSAELRYRVEPGASPAIAFPSTGPFDERRGYTRLAQMSRRLAREGYRITEQARQSPQLRELIASGIAPPFRERSVARLVIRDVHGRPIYDADDGSRIWKSLDEIPSLVVSTLLFIENRSIGDGAGPMQNPAIDWGRSTKAFALYVGRSLGFRWPLEGGSTLATQLQKFRHSPGGHTGSAMEKLRQIIGASLAAYHEGLRTRAERRQIILDYLNTMPLGAVPGVGEVNGLANGLMAWFGLSPDAVLAALRSPDDSPAKARAYREVLALLYSVHAPTYYLMRDHAALDERIDAYLGLLERAGIIDRALLAEVKGVRLKFATARIAALPPRFIDKKAVDAERRELSRLLGVPSLYDVDRLNLQVDSTIDASLQSQVLTVLKQLDSPEFVATHGLRAPQLLDRGDPRGVTYSMLLVESLPEGNFVRVHTDTLDAPFDLNDDMKLELGSTAKLRTLAHYLEVVAELYDHLHPLGPAALAARVAAARDPITRWAAMNVFATPGLSCEELLKRALERRYSGSPDEEFFTGGGFQRFRNFEPQDDTRVLTVREALIHSTNLVFIRLMRDLVLYHEARLPYDTQTALYDLHSRVRRRLLREIAAEEQRKTHRSFRWLLHTTDIEAQDRRLQTKMEEDAFARMTPYWRRLGFPFQKLVPSYATAIGCSADRPAALAVLMGIIVNNGRLRPTYDISRLTFARGTPYQTVLEPKASRGEQVMRPEIARLLRGVLAQVVESGTARQLKGAFRDADGALIAVGGKTGSGDNRYETFTRDGRLLSAYPVSRTGVFVFYLGKRWFGVITAAVDGPKSGHYSFTSSLPLVALKLLAPAFSAAVDHERIPQLLTQELGDGLPP